MVCRMWAGFRMRAGLGMWAGLTGSSDEVEPGTPVLLTSTYLGFVRHRLVDDI